MDYDLAEPHASSLIEALRAVGYSIHTALADLIDNSISAGAKNVWLQFEWNGRDSWITLRDDGNGMTEAQLVEAMRPGTRSPLDERSPEDLGRFGLGLKTASFSQARRLTVGSKTRAGDSSVRRWDLDYVRHTGEWRLLRSAAAGSEWKLDALGTTTSGTIVVWELMDRVVPDVSAADRPAHDRFLKLVDSVRAHLGMVFHRFLADRALRIFVNGATDSHRVMPWDPFVTNSMATQMFPDEFVAMGATKVRVKGFVLPHKDKLTEAEHQLAAGPGGWNAQQGMYVYRNRRLLVGGGWLDLGWTNEEHYKLARVLVDIPNSSDAEWELDVKKSRARPPALLQPRLRELAEAVRSVAREVYAYRGKRVAQSATGELVRPWQSVTRDDRLSYRINRQHPLVLKVSETDKPKAAFDALLRLLEATVPVQQIWLDAAERPESHARPFESEPSTQVRSVLLELFRTFRQKGASASVARERLLLMEPFNLYPALVATLSEGED